MSNPDTRPTILVVDDDSAIRDMLGDVLKLEGYTVETAKNGQEAIDIVTGQPTTVRVMVLDLLMPIIDGAGVVRWLIEHNDIRARTKIILISANHVLRASMDLVRDGELAKPLGVDSLLALIKKLS